MLKKKKNPHPNWAGSFDKKIFSSEVPDNWFGSTPPPQER